MLRYLVAGLVLSAGVVSATEIQQRSFVSSIFDNVIANSRTLDIGSIATIVFVLIIADVIFTIILAATVGAGKRSNDSPVYFPIITNTIERLGDSWDYVSDVVSEEAVDRALDYMNITEESCRQKVICKLEQAAVSNPLTRFGVNTVNSNLKGLQRNYYYAVDAGLSGQDCDLLYYQCNRDFSF